MVSAETTPRETAKKPGAEPLPGYKLVEPLGSGGFGEVWKCQVPGGLTKAIKFVAGDSHPLDGDNAPARQEREALEHIKNIRHPFILSMERVELLGSELAIVMELADKNLHELMAEYQTTGKPGIPRRELLAYLREAAEVLDFMNFQHELQHLDIKPRNLFLVCRHIKVADFGLVSSLSQRQDGSAPLMRAGATPLYASPEIFNGWISGQSDQYSLAVTYQELLTGTLPIQGKNLRQLMLNHLTAEPKLDALPTADRPIVARALSKEAEKRFPSCLEFIQSLAQGSTVAATMRPWENGAVAEELPDVLDDTSPQLAAATPSEVKQGDSIPGYTLLDCISPN